jgi:hypothetical protein
LLHSSTYNIGESHTLSGLQQILEWGHEIVLHYDGSFFVAADLAPLDGIKMEADYLGGILRTKILSVVQHRPAVFGRVSAANAGFVDAYDPRLIKEIEYLVV